LNGIITVVPGDKNTIFGSHASKKYQKIKLLKEETRKKEIDKIENEMFEMELNRKATESKEVSDEVNETLSRGRSPSPSGDMYKYNGATTANDGESVENHFSSSTLDDERQQAIADSLAMYKAMKR